MSERMVTVRAECPTCKKRALMDYEDQIDRYVCRGCQITYTPPEVGRPTNPNLLSLNAPTDVVE